MTKHNDDQQRSWPVSQAAERIRRRQQKKLETREQRRKRAQEWGRTLAETIAAKDPNVTKVIGFGSAYETWRTFREDSDVDLAIIGGNWSYISRFVTGGEFKVSLVELELQNPEFLEHVLSHGEVLYEKQ